MKSVLFWFFATVATHTGGIYCVYNLADTGNDMWQLGNIGCSLLMGACLVTFGKKANEFNLS